MFFGRYENPWPHYSGRMKSFPRLVALEPLVDGIENIPVGGIDNQEQPPWVAVDVVSCSAMHYHFIH